MKMKENSIDNWIDLIEDKKIWTIVKEKSESIDTESKKNTKPARMSRAINNLQSKQSKLSIPYIILLLIVTQKQLTILLSLEK
jgi:hypothetical protein